MSHPDPGPPRLLLCINPDSGAGRGAGAGSEAAARLRSGGADVVILEVPGEEDSPPAARYAAALTERLAAWPSRGPDAVVVVGGDGMVHVTANVLGHPPRSVDLARVELQSLGDAGGAGTRDAGTGASVVRYAVSGVNVAFDAAVNATANSMRWPRGSLRYVVAVLRELLRYRPAVLRVLLDGVPGLSGPSFVLCVMNGRFIGGGMEITPGTRLDDGVLEVFHVPPLNPVRFLRVFPRVFSGRHTDIPEVSIRPARSVLIEGAGPEPVGAGKGSVAFGDGEDAPWRGIPGPPSSGTIREGSLV